MSNNNVVQNVAALVNEIHAEISDLDELTVNLVLDMLAVRGLTIVEDPDGTVAEAMVVEMQHPEDDDA